MRFPQSSAIHSLLTITAVLTSGLWATSVSADEGRDQPLVVKQHSTPAGQGYFALALKPTDGRFATVKRHVIVVDTSASQVGHVRDSSLKLVNQITAGLSPNCEVQILAVDVECESLTDGYVRAASREVNEALQQLVLRTPLGATNLKCAFQKILATADQRPTSVVYIGDGMTACDIIQVEEMNTLVSQFADQHISVHSLILGPQTNQSLPTVLADLTGGTTASVEAGQEARIAASTLKSLTIAPQTVVSVSVDGRTLELAGTSTCRVRPDRHSVVCGRGLIPEFKTVTAKTTDGETLTWSSAFSERGRMGAELKQLVQTRTDSRGLRAGVVSLADLNRASENFAASMMQTAEAIEYLERRGRYREARQYLNNAIQQDSGNRRLRAILTGFGQDAVTPAPQPPAGGPAFGFPDEPEAAPSPDAPAPAPSGFQPVPEPDPNVPLPAATPAPVAPVDPAVLVDPQAPAPPSFDGNQPPVVTPADPNELPAAQEIDPLKEVEQTIQLQTQILTQQTNRTIDEASRLGFDQPEYSISLLKDTLETIRASTDISPDVRQQLESRVVNAISGVQNRQQISQQIQRQQAVQRAVRQTQEANLREEAIEEERLAILIDTVRGLLERGRHGDPNGFEDGESVSRTALTLRPGNGPATQALVMSEALGQLSKAYNLVNLRHDRFLEVLYQVELSHVPFPDEPPIQYPPADVWRALSLTRVPRYESFDLRIEAPVEKWLREMLDKPIPPLDFPGAVPLSEIMETISQYYTTTYGAGGGAAGTDFRMTIYPDRAELDLEGISELEDVTVKDISFQGLTLRNALKLIFEQTTDPELTYIIEDEVFKVTTLAKAESEDNLVTRVYPVGDLVIPPQQLGGQQGGGLGGGGLQGGGFGGGQQGGGQQGGFGGGGGGQGFQSIPPEIIQDMQDAAKNGITNKTINQLKKKPVLN